MVIISTIPPDPTVEAWYNKVLDYKDGRTAISPDKIEAWMRLAGIVNIKIQDYTCRQSIKNWLDNGSLSFFKRRKIFKMHLNMDKECAKAYNMEVVDGGKDILIDIKFRMFKGSKH